MRYHGGGVLLECADVLFDDGLESVVTCLQERDLARFGMVASLERQLCIDDDKRWARLWSASPPYEDEAKRIVRRSDGEELFRQALSLVRTIEPQWRFLALESDPDSVQIPRLVPTRYARHAFGICWRLRSQRLSLALRHLATPTSHGGYSLAAFWSAVCVLASLADTEALASGELVELKLSSGQADVESCDLLLAGCQLAVMLQLAAATAERMPEASTVVAALCRSSRTGRPRKPSNFGAAIDAAASNHADGGRCLVARRWNMGAHPSPRRNSFRGRPQQEEHLISVSDIGAIMRNLCCSNDQNAPMAVQSALWPFAAWANEHTPVGINEPIIRVVR